MSSIERDLAPTANRQSNELTDLYNQLRDLNKQYQGQRKKPFAERDPMYEAQRNPILQRKEQLQGSQYLIRRQLRQK